MGEARQSGARLLKELRQERGWSWKEEAHTLKGLAQQLGIRRVTAATTTSIERSIARWESGDYEYRPDQRYQLLLAHAYATRNGRAALGPGSDFDRLMDAFAAMGIPLDRRQALRALVTAAVTVGPGAVLAFLTQPLQGRLGAVLDDPSRLDRATLQGLARAVVALQQLSGGAVPFIRVKMALWPILEVFSRLLQGSQPSAIRQELCIVAARCFSLAARLSFELHDYPNASALYDEALVAADELHDSWVGASTLASRSMVTLYGTGDLNKAIAVATQATERSLAGSSYAVRARAFAVRAEMAARAGDRLTSLRTLRLSRAHLDLNHETDPTEGSFSQARLRGFEGICHVRLGLVSDGDQELQQAAAGLDETRDSVQKSIIMADLALARIRTGDPEAASETLRQSIDLVATTRGRVGTQRIYHVRRELDRWHGEPFIAELDRHLLASLLGQL
jgi:transcriptional regulator with XRE-family HTH domain